ncbi:MAG: Chemotaxis protein methyltransferase CheR, partial [Bryobacterales bacterium]|nr:Chemotaxis protein methyltransferase CheR [Bryobacterales bacterium]
ERLEQQLLLLVEASGTLLSASDSGTIVETIIELGRRFVAADAYALWRTGPTARNEWCVVSAAGLSDTYSRHTLPGSTEVPLPEHAVATEDVYAEPLLAGRHEEYCSEGIRSMLTVPLRMHGAVNGMLVFYYRDRRSFEPSEITVATALGNLAAAALANADLYDEQRTLRQEAEKAHERSLFLAKTGALLATSLDIDRTLAAIADLAVPSIADWCAVDLLEPGEHFRRVSVKHSDPEKVAIARAFHERYPPEPGSSVWGAMHGETVFASEIIEEKLRATVHDEEHLALLLQLGLKSFVIAPLIVHGEQLGMLTLVAAESGRRYDSGDIQFVEEVAQRAAFAVHSARLHQALRESVARLRAAAAAAEVGIFEWQMDADEALWENPRMYEIFGRTLEDGPLGRHEFFSLVAHPDDADTMMRGLLAAMEPGGVFKTGGRIFRKNGEVRWVELSGRFEFTPKGKPHRLIGAVSDVTERRRMEDRLRETAKLESIGILAGGIAHDFNNLLTGILGNASLSSELLDSDHPVQDFLNDVVKASERAAALTGQMLAYSGRGTFVVSEIDLAALVREIAPLIRTSVARTVDLDLHLGSKLSPISADGAQMQQIVMNLIINGAEAMGDKPGKVTVSTHECTLDADYVRVLSAPMEVTPGRYVCLEVEDHGCGMDQATIARIFDPFFTTKFTGRGLGLSAVLGIVRAHHGALNVYSDPGVGTTFKVFFPVRIATPQPVPAERPHRESGPTVLVIDDEDIVLRTAQIMLDRAGYRVVTAKNGDEALQIFRRLHDEIALVFLDLTMPVMGGEETLSRLKEIRPGVRVVLSTGFTDGATLKRLDDRLVGHLEKPYSAGRLRELLRELLP